MSYSDRAYYVAPTASVKRQPVLSRLVRFGAFGALAATLLGPTLCGAIDLGKHGPTYPIAEVDFVEEMGSIAKRNVASGEWKKTELAVQRGLMQKLQNFPPVAAFATAVSNKTWMFDPTVTLQQPIFDQHGAVMYATGTKVNPLDVIPLSEPFMFIDARDTTQVALAITRHKAAGGNLKLILIAGNYLRLARSWPAAVYFDQHGFMTSQLGIKTVPALVSQLGNQLRIEELKP